jgi:hypothetical protein
MYLQNVSELYAYWRMETVWISLQTTTSYRSSDQNGFQNTQPTLIQSFNT